MRDEYLYQDRIYSKGDPLFTEQFRESWDIDNDPLRTKAYFDKNGPKYPTTPDASLIDMFATPRKLVQVPIPAGSNPEDAKTAAEIVNRMSRLAKPEGVIGYLLLTKTIPHIEAIGTLHPFKSGINLRTQSTFGLGTDPFTQTVTVQPDTSAFIFEAHGYSPLDESVDKVLEDTLNYLSQRPADPEAS